MSKQKGKREREEEIGKERANKMARVKWGRGKREANGKQCNARDRDCDGYLVWLTCLREPPRQRRQKFFLLPLEHCVGFPRRGEDDAVK